MAAPPRRSGWGTARTSSRRPAPTCRTRASREARMAGEVPGFSAGQEAGDRPDQQADVPPLQSAPPHRGRVSGLAGHVCGVSRRGPHGLPSRLPGVPHRALRVRGDPERRRPRLHVLRRQDQPIAEREKMKATYPGFEFVYGDSEFTPDNPPPAGLVATALQADHDWLYLVNAETDREDFCSDPFRRDHLWSKLPLRGAARQAP